MAHCDDVRLEYVDGAAVFSVRFPLKNCGSIMASRKWRVQWAAGTARHLEIRPDRGQLPKISPRPSISPYVRANYRPKDPRLSGCEQGGDLFEGPHHVHFYSGPDVFKYSALIQMTSKDISNYWVWFARWQDADIDVEAFSNTLIYAVSGVQRRGPMPVPV